MNLTFHKKNKILTAGDFREKPFSPEKDWLFIMSAFLVGIILAIIASAIVFYDLMNKSEYSTSPLQGEEMPVEIDKVKLQSALDFLNPKKLE